MDEKPNYYAVIPANVRYDKELSDKAKLLYGEISALSNKSGICWASNEYFSTLYETSTRTITRLIKELSDLGYITLKITEGKSRQICLGGIDKNVQGTLDKNVYHNNTSINNTSNNITPIYPLKENFELFWSAYPKKQNKAKAKIWFEKNKPNEELMNIILSKLEMFKRTKEWKKNNGQFIPMPTTWLNGKRWEDEIDDSNIEMTDEEQNAEVERMLREEGFYENR